eukprot:TRINITY_DN28834_c0_g1_i1.p1 TRINITY_DN28834_c0_g1~~TRINITY_DN28834_c0_g1_i1.p1  ORF type:complete len:132 (-),score=37.80 TRINITY_DN28834_c0_g1_i1:25-420(-)
MGRKLTLKLGGRKLPDKDRFSKSDPFLIVFNVSSSGAFKFVKRTEVKKNNLNPDWKELEFEDGELDLGKSSTIVRFEVLDDDGRGKAEHLGSAVFTLAQLEAASQQGTSLQLLDKERHAAGHVVVQSYRLD